MIESHSASRFTKRRRALIGGLLLILLIVLFAVYFYTPLSVLWFYFTITQRIDIGDAGLISGTPCASPCVFGIQAGKTRLDQVLPLLKTNGFDSSNCFTEPSVSWILISCGANRFKVQINAQTKIVNSIEFQPNTSISVGEIIKKYGEPNFVGVSHDKLQEGPTIQMSLYWDSNRMLIVLPKINAEIYNIEKATMIEEAIFSDEELYQDSSEIEFGPFYKLWKGFGAYQP
jgi:hypothetical protein